ncbi:putative mitochondrial protein [Trifolium repens]|nr:putative mitochondrial protein [Trifolium repens]
MATEEVIGNSAVGATEKPFKFEGLHFKRWQQKMYFFLTLKKVVNVLNEDMPIVTVASASGTKEITAVVNGEKSDAAEKDKDPTDSAAAQIKAQELQLKKERQLWLDNDYLCKGYIINGLSDDLYDYYSSYKSAKDVWEALKKKYDTEEAGVKKYAVSRYLKYQMVDERSVEAQSHEIQKIAHEIITEGMPLDEQFQIAVIIDKLPLAWKDFKNILRHKTKEFSIESLITRLRIEEESRRQDMKEEEKILVVSNNKKKPGAVLKPTGKPFKNQNRTANNRVKNGNPSKGPNARQQPPPPKNDSGEFLCFNCWKPGHMAKKCRNPSRPKPAHLKGQVNVAEEAYAAMITEINMIGVSDGWWIDTGATRHVCFDRAMFKTYTNAENKKVQMGNAHTSDVAGIGDIELKFTSGKTLILKDVMHVPEMKKNLVSGFLLNKAGFSQAIGADLYTITKNGIFIGKGYATDGMFKLNVDLNSNKISTSVYSLCDFNIWHSRLCHVNMRSISNLSHLGLIPKLNFNDINKCEFCSQAKITKSSHKSVIRKTELMELIHSDICELDGTLTRNNKRYFITFIDDYSDYTIVYLMKNKSDAFDMFKMFVNEIENQFGMKIKRFRSDRGTEYNSSLFIEFYKEHGIIHETTAPYSPEMNGKAERKNRTLTELVVAIMLTSGAASHWWGEIILTVCYLLNRVPKSKEMVSPYEKLKKRQPNLSYLRTWGCLAYVRIPDPKRVKLASRAYECAFIGYAANSKAYRFYDLNAKVIIESNDADFYENKFPFKSRNSGGTESSHIPVIRNSESNNEVENELRRSKRVRVAKDYGPDYSAYNLEEDPTNLQEALSSLDADLWQEAINDEMESLESNRTWHLVDLPPGCKPIGCKWILKKKLKPDGTIDKYKARLVAKGFRQRENIDFFDTFSPVTRITSIRVLISIAAIYNLTLHQMDVKTAFLNGDLEEEIYMEQPEGFVIHGQENKVCKLDKSLYGLKQAPKQWHEKFDNLMLSNGFKVNESDKCIYYKFENGICTIICLYVDDLLIFGSNLSAVNAVKSLLGNNFDMKDLGEANVILGIKITRSEKGISLDQSHYVEKILKKYGYYDCKPACTPYDPSVKLFKNTGESVRQTAYASIIGSLRYATDCTRPDIAYVVGLLCRFTSRPSNEHWQAIERVMRYLKRTMNLGLHYQRFPAVLEGYSDADWNTLSDDSKATSGFIFSIAGGAVSWKSKKQTILAQSTMESEMIALATANEEASWLRCLLSEIPLWEKPMPAVLIHCDSTAAIAKIENRFYNGKRRQIRRKHCTVRELITKGAVRVDHVRIDENLADPLTKGLAREKVQNTSVKMGLKPMNCS